MTQIRIGYINVRGLTEDKWRHLLQLVNPTPTLSTLTFASSSPMDILFVAETWFVDHAKHMGHPATVISTPPPLDRGKRLGRQHGGLLALVNPAFRSRIHSASCTSHSISVVLAPQTQSPAAAKRMTHITAVYFPPSLDATTISDLLRSLPSNTTVLLGDINVRYGVDFADRESGPSERRLVIDRALHSARNMVHLRPTHGTTRVDHAFVLQERTLAPTLAFAAPPFSCDHPMMTLSWSTPQPESSPPVPSAPGPRPARRYFLKHLNDPAVSRQLCELYDVLAETPTAFMDHLWLEWPTLSPADRKGCVDHLDEQLLLLINTLCEELLGSYLPSKIQDKVADRMEYTLTALARPISSSEAVRLFKRSQRVRRDQSCLQSREPMARTAAEDAVAYLSNIYQAPRIHPGLLPYDNILASAGSPNGNERVDVTDRRTTALVALFTPASVRHAIASRRQGKSPGPDAMDVTVLKALLPSGSFLANLSSFFRLCAAAGYTPRRWNESLIHPIPKSATSAPTIDEHRPISLTVMFRRIFESVLLLSLSTAPWARLHPSQAGFRRGFSTVTHALAAHEASRLGILNTHVFVDLKQAYDRVPIQLLLHKLAGRLQDPAHPLTALIGSLFLECYSRVAVNKGLSDRFPRHRGLFQGSLLSPWLFDIFIDDLAVELNGGQYTMPPGQPIPTALLFADDILIQAASLAKAQDSLDRLSAWIERNGMEPNIAKCGVIIDTDTETRLPLRLCGQLVPVVAAYRYLGFPFRQDIGIDWKGHMEASILRATRFISALAATGTSRLWTAHTRLTLYKAYARPLFEYGAPVVCQWLLANYRGRRRRRRAPISRLGRPASLASPSTPMLGVAGPDLWEDLENAQDKALAWIFGVTRPLPLIRSLSALGTMQHRFNELACRFTMHLGAMHAENPTRALLEWSSLSYTALPRPLPLSPGAQKPCALLQSCTLHPLRTLFYASSATGPAMGLMACLRSFLLAHRLAELSRSYLLPGYIAFSCRHPVSGVDALLALQDNKLYRQALAWRRNVVAVHRTCPTCLSKFNRSHVHGCHLLDDGPEISQLLLTAYAGDERTVHFTQRHFTILDFLLNEKQYALFDACIVHIKNKLSNVQSVTVQEGL